MHATEHGRRQAERDDACPKCRQVDAVSYAINRSGQLVGKSDFSVLNWHWSMKGKR